MAYNKGIMKFLFLIFSLFLATKAYGIQMLPMEAEIVPGEGNMAEFTLKNDSVQPVAMKISVFERRPDSFGNEKYDRNASHLFEIVKPNLILMGKDDPRGRNSRKVRVYYKGKKNITKEQSYRVIVEQLPVDLDRKNRPKNKVRFLAKFVASLYITPRNAKPNLIIKNVQKTGSIVGFSITNTGNRRNFIENLQIVFEGISSSNKRVRQTFKKEALKNIYHHNVLAGKTRHFRFALPSKVLRTYPKAQKINVSFY